MVDEGTDVTAAGVAPRHRRRGRVVAAVVVGAVVAAGVAVLAAAPWSDDGATPPDSTATATAAVGETDAASLGRHLLVDRLPEGWQLNSVGDAIEDGFAVEGSVALFAAADSTAEDGPWLAIEVVDDQDGGGSETAATTVAVGGGGGEPAAGPVVVNGVEATRSTTFDGADSIAFTTDEGQSVRVVSRGVSDELAVTFAEAIRFDVDGRGTIGIGREALVEELPVVYRATGAGTLPVTNGLELNTAYAPVQLYYSNGSDQYAQLTVADVTSEDDVLAAARVLLADATDVTVHGLPAVLGASVRTGGDDTSVLTWVEDDHVVTLFGLVDDETLLDMAESVRTATAVEWDDLLDIGRFGGIDARTAATAQLFAAGDFDDRGDWNIVASDDQSGSGAPEVCLEAQYTAVCAPTATGPFPVLVGTPRMEFAVGIYAMVEPGVEGAVLRVTEQGADPIDIPLADNANLPGPAAGWAVEARRSFRAELVAADGTVLASLADTDLPPWKHAGPDDAVTNSSVEPPPMTVVG